MTRTASHETECRVRSYELDPYDHLNNGVYVNWFEDARELFLRTRDRDWNHWPRVLGLWFVVARIDCEYLEPALAGEVLVLRTRLARIGAKSVTFRQSLRRRDTGAVLARARVVMCFSADGAATPVPADFLDRFEVSPAGDAWAADEGPDRG